MAKQTFSVGQTLTAAQMTSLQQTAMLGGAASAKTASYTLVAADAGTAISMTSASATTITVNTALFAAGDTVQITNLGAGVCTITAGTATVNTASSLVLAQYESGTLDFTSTSAAIFIKGMGAAAPSGGMTLIGETVASASASVSFTSISDSYKQLLLVWQGIYHAEVHYNFGIRLNNDSTDKYNGINMGFVNSTAGIQVFDSSDCSATQIGGAQYSPFGFGGTSTTLENTASGFFLLDNYSSSTKLKCYNMTFKYRRGSAGDYYYCNTTGTYDSTTAITQLNIFGNGGTISNATNTSIRLYGLS
jgi:hypothetical protein